MKVYNIVWIAEKVQVSVAVHNIISDKLKYHKKVQYWSQMSYPNNTRTRDWVCVYKAKGLLWTRRWAFPEEDINLWWNLRSSFKTIIEMAKYGVKAY